MFEDPVEDIKSESDVRKFSSNFKINVWKTIAKFAGGQRWLVPY